MDDPPTFRDGAPIITGPFTGWRPKKMLNLFDYIQEIEDELLERIKKFAKCGKLCLNLVPIFKMYKNINIVFILRKY